jgi:hypothetical protein
MSLPDAHQRRRRLPVRSFSCRLLAIDDSLLRQRALITEA